MPESESPKSSPKIDRKYCFVPETFTVVLAEPLYRHAVEEFERLKKLRPELPNEPISGDEEPTEPQENTTNSCSPQTSPNEPISFPSVRPE